MIKTRFTFFILLLMLMPLQAQNKMEKPDALMLRFPDVSMDKIVFSYAGDLWIVSKEGGTASKLSSPKGQEILPKFSPDGNWIAFSGNYDGNIDVYLMSAQGGMPKRLTHNPAADLVVEWYPDGKNILYRSGMTTPSNRFNRFYKESIDGGLPEELPLKYGELASFNKDASQMAFQTISREFRTWKRYRGGMASDLWLYDFKKNTAEKITNFEGTDALPMWHKNTIYFLSDRGDNKKENIWAYDVNTKKIKQITNFDEYDIKWPSIGPDDIVFENGGELFLLDLATEKSKPVDIKVPADLPQDRVQLKNLSKNINNFSLSPSGKRALFGARGEVVTVPQKNGSIQDITNTSSVAERYPAWSPDGKYIAYFSDRTGEYELYIRPADGSGNEKQITKGGRGYRYDPVWSPDSKSIVFRDKAGNLFIVNLEDGTPKLIDKNDYNFNLSYSWSPDSKWIAYDNNISLGIRDIYVYDVKEAVKHKITDGYYNSTNPVFDPDGKYIFFYSNRTFRPVYSDMDITWIYPNSADLMAVTLQKDAPSPVAPKNDVEPVKKDEAKEKKEDKKSDKKDGKEKEIKPVKIDFDGIDERIVKLPAKVGNAGALFAVKGKVIFQKNPAAGAAKPGTPSGAIVYYDLDERDTKDIINGINTFDVSADGKKIIYKSNSAYGIIDVAANKKVGDGKITVDKMQAFINPKEEWVQIFNDSWRIERDYFYDPGMHGLNWEAIKKRYAALLPYVVDRADLNYVIGEMIAELNSSHTYVGGGDIERPKTINVGLLGCDYELKDGYYRIKKIYEGGPWDNAEARSPLKEPGIDVKEGDYLIAVNHQPVDITKDPWAAFQDLAGEVVTLTINSKPSPKGSRDVVVKPLKSESRLRYLAWVEENRQLVDKATDGKVGYIYVPNTGINGQNELVRQFLPQVNKEALIVDERFNSGGQIPDRFIELLNRPIYNYWARRDFKDWQTPFISNPGPKVMLINGWSGSGGDAFPYYFRKAGLGPLIGKRTWGGLIGIGGTPTPIDGGFLSAPHFGLWNTEGKWDVEGHGVSPDYDVENNPAQLADGHDQQLEKGIEVIKELLKKNPPVKMKKPVYPDRSK